MGKYLKTMLVGLLAGFLLISAQAEAAPETLTIMPSGAAEEPVLTGLFVGQTHRYKVIFRGNGEAIVYANIDFTNTTDNTLNEFVFETPVEVKDMTILQYDKVTCPTYYTYDIEDKKCAMISESLSIAYPSSYYYGGIQNVYQRAKFVQDGNKYTVTLPTPLEVNGDSFLLLGFTTKEFTTDFLGGYEYSFESLTVDSRITSLTINIDVDGGLLLKNASNASVNYSTAGAEKTVAPDTAVVNEDLDQLVSYMSYSGSISKQFMELSYGETVTMTGEYASTWLRLYMKEISVVVLIIVLFFVALIVGVKLYKKYHKSSPKNDKPSSDSKMWIVADTATGFGSALLIVLFTLAIMFLGSYLAYISYDYSYGYAYGMFMLLFFIISVLVYGFLALFGPIYRGRKKGWLSFGLTFFSEILFLIIIAFIFVGVILIPTSYPIPY